LFGQSRQSLRALRRRPAFTATAVLTLALGTGATTALFSVVDTVLLKSLPYPDPYRLVTVYEASTSSHEKVSLIAPVRLDDWTRMNRTFTSLAGAYSESVTDTSGADPERLDGRRVTPGYFAVFGAKAIVGRTFNADEERFGGPGAAVVSEGLWMRRYQRDSAVLDHALSIGGRSYAIVGVMPRAFSSTTVDVWLPAQFNQQMMQLREARFLSGVGRLKPDAAIAQARDDLDRVQRELGVTYPQTDKDWSASVQDLKDARVGDRRQALWLLFGAVALLWLIAIANVAGLVLVHVRRRRQELAIRTAIGASRARVIALVMQEMSLIALAGCAVGTGLAAWVVQVVRTTFPTLPRVIELSLDWRALVCALVTSVAAVIGSGLLPALQATRRRTAPGLASRAVIGDAHRLQRILVTAQVALSVLLCSSAALFVRSYYNLAHVNPGFTADGVVTFHVGARWDEDRARVGQLQEQLIATLGQQPGVEAVGLSNFLPATGATLRSQIAVDGLVGPDANGTMTVGTRTISVGYLRALRVPLVAGQWCPAMRFDFNAPPTAMVNRRFVERFGHGQNLVGREFHFAGGPSPAHTIVGVVGDVSEDGPRLDAVPYVYACESAAYWPDPEYVVRAADPAAVLGSLRAIVHTLDGGRAVFGMRMLDDVVRASTDEPRMNAGVVTIFAAAAMMLAAIGLYGLFMLVVSESRREIGVRLALGATPGQMVQLVFTGAGRLLLVGIAVGLGLTAGADRVWRALLFGVSTLDAPTLLAATLTLVTVSALAIAVPAIKASRVAPTDALRGE
jgi:putative ABC transport system permease protein